MQCQRPSFVEYPLVLWPLARTLVWQVMDSGIISLQMTCFLCKSGEAQPWFVKENRGVAYPIVRCTECRSAYVWPRPDPEILNAIYSTEDYADPELAKDGTYWPTGEQDAKRLFNRFGFLFRGKTFLDIGAGEGIASAEALRRGFSVLACEPSPQSRKAFAQRNGFEPDPCFFDSAYAETRRGLADVALLSHVLEHLREPDGILSDIRSVLRPGGSLVIAVPLFGSVITTVLGKGDFFISPPEHLSFYSLKGLTAILARNGFLVDASYSSSKVNLLRYRRALGPVCYAVNAAGYVALRFSELAKRSVVINVCARNIS
jgi:SAM-dependent methyltransferase